MKIKHAIEALKQFDPEKELVVVSKDGTLVPVYSFIIKDNGNAQVNTENK